MTATGDRPAQFADQIDYHDAPLEQRQRIARDTYRIRIPSPKIAAAVVPGQFVMLRLAGRDAPLIGRAMAVWDVIDDDAGRPRAIDLVFVRKGALTTPLADAPLGTRVALWGPLGNSFSSSPCDLLVIAAGGVGQTPMLILGQEARGLSRFPRGPAGPRRPHGWAQEVLLVYGARSADRLAGVDDFRAAGLQVELCTDDGSTGRRGRVPDLLFPLVEARLEASPGRRVRMVTCGPEAMMQQIAEGADRRGWDCEVSMETPMACGIGICFSCVAMIRTGPATWDYKRTCVEGPIFRGHELRW